MEHRYSLWALVIVSLAVLILGVAAATYSITKSQEATNKNRDLICLLDRVFGLDRPVDPALLKRVSSEQRDAINDLIGACPHGR